MKHIRLAGYDVDLLLDIEMQMRCHFDDHLIYSIWDFNKEQTCRSSGMILVFTDFEYNYAIKNYSGDGSVVLGKLMLTCEAYEMLLALAMLDDFSFVHLCEELAQGYMKHLLAYNFPCVIDSCSISSLPDNASICGHHTIMSKINTQMENEQNRISVFEGFLMDRSTLIHIGFAMDLDDIIYPQDLLNKHKPCCSSDRVLSEIISRNNQFRSELGMINQIMDDAVIAVDIQGIVQIYSQKAKSMFLYSSDEVVGKTGFDLFKPLAFDYVLSNEKPLKDKLIEVNGKNLIVTVNLIYHGKKLYGAIAMIREFYEEEVKQHAFRKQIIDKGHKAKYRFEDLKGNSKALTDLKSVAERMSKSDSSVLIYGESGTGKELIAQAMHFTSCRSKYQFVALNCGALPESLLESELFGYEEGAFTGARKGGKPGLFELAHQGTIFLDEIGEMPINTQIRLLRVLQEREVMRIGSDRMIKIDVRVIAASNKNLKDLVKEGRFREDLYYRLCVLPLKVPALRDRTEDLKDLIQHFKDIHSSGFDFTDEALELLEYYHWPGNIRELRNYVEYWTNLGKTIITKVDLPFLEDIEFASRKSNDARHVDFEKYIEYTHQPLGVSTFLLNSLHIGKNNNQRIGRKSLYTKCRESGYMLSEHEIRHLLLQMESFGYVEILKGRGGTVITPLGINALNYFQQC